MNNFKQHIQSFLDNGESILTEYIPALIQTLKQIYKTIQSLDTCRFYAASLLIVYDAGWAKTNTNRSVDVKMIDFAHSVFNLQDMRSVGCEKEGEKGVVYVAYPPTTKGPDSGYMKGLESLISCLTTIYEENHDLMTPATQESLP